MHYSTKTEINELKKQEIAAITVSGGIKQFIHSQAATIANSNNGTFSHLQNKSTLTNATKNNRLAECLAKKSRYL